MAKAKELVSDETAPKPTVKTVHMHAGVDLIGSKSTASSMNNDIYELSNAVLIVSKKSKRKVVVPFANIRGYELF